MSITNHKIFCTYMYRFYNLLKKLDSMNKTVSLAPNLNISDKTKLLLYDSLLLLRFHKNIAKLIKLTFIYFFQYF